MLRDASPTDFAAIRDLLARANDAPYDISVVAEEKLQAGVWGEPAVRLYDDGAIRGVAVTCGRFLRLLAVAREHRRRGIGSALVADSEASVVAAEPGNYFTPGVVTDDQATIRFFAGRGFRETRWTRNLAVELAAVPDSPLPRARQEDRARVVDFVRRRFGRIWAFEADRAFENDPPTIFHLDQIGFAAHEANNRGLGSFGPAGVIDEERGRGHGRELLLASLADLRRMGYARAIIPWTDADQFYQRSCGAKPAHRFLTLSR